MSFIKLLLLLIIAIVLHNIYIQHNRHTALRKNMHNYAQIEAYRVIHKTNLRQKHIRHNKNVDSKLL